MRSNDERFEALETKLAFQEDTIAQLNDALIEQQSRIDDLETSVRTLLERIDEEPDLPSLTPQDERPPHY